MDPQTLDEDALKVWLKTYTPTATFFRAKSILRDYIVSQDVEGLNTRFYAMNIENYSSCIYIIASAWLRPMNQSRKITRWGSRVWTWVDQEGI